MDVKGFVLNLHFQFCLRPESQGQDDWYQGKGPLTKPVGAVLGLSVTGKDQSHGDSTGAGQATAIATQLVFYLLEGGTLLPRGPDFSLALLAGNESPEGKGDCPIDYTQPCGRAQLQPDPAPAVEDIWE